MKSMRLRLGFPPDALMPVHEGLCASPDLDREVILGGQSVDGVETISSFVYGDPAAYEALLVDQDTVVEYDVTPADDGCYVYLRQELDERGMSMLDSFAQETVVVVPPIEFRSDRTMRTTLVGHPDDLRTVLDSVPDGIELDVRRVGDGVLSHDDTVSARQREALRTARELGYYDVPRDNGIETVASELGCAVSTASELLRRGEARAVARLVDSDW